MGLTRYREKRNFRKTPEPRGTVRQKDRLFAFVVQKHDASTLHYDFRLEIDGVLKSWAVPKGPSMDPSVRRLAMQVEDHPLEYRTFEGTIPEGEYGAGEVIVWDEGTFTAADAGDPEEVQARLHRGWEQGKLSFVLNGHKLKGGFSLIRLNRRDRKAWLLMKKKDEYASRDDVTADTRSVRSNRSLGTAAANAAPAAAVRPPAARKSAPVQEDTAAAGEFIHPMLAHLTREAFDDPNWLFEIKWDGYRAIAEIRSHTVRLYSRSGTSFVDRYKPVVQSLGRMNQDAILDGEVVALDDNGRSSFQLLQNYQRTGEGNLFYCVFDILEHNGKDLKGEPLSRRKEILRSLLPDLPHLKYSDHVVKKGKAFFEAAKRQHLEGIMAKDMRSPYRPGERSEEWLKVKTGLRQEVVIGGFTQPKGTREQIGALVLGVYEGNDLVYVGHAGGGFNRRSLRAVRQRLEPLIRATSPFREPPRTNTPVTWVEPTLVCEVAFAEWTRDGILRQPIFLGLREDKKARDVVRERPAARPGKRNHDAQSNREKTEIRAARRTVVITHPDKLYWPDEGITKMDLVDYYHHIAPVMLPYLKERPHALRRQPNGIESKGFFQKDVGDDLPDWIQTIPVHAESSERDIKYLVCTDEASLLTMANLGCIEINPWFSRVSSLDRPDYLVLDLDPEGVGFDAVVEVANVAKKVLDRARAHAYCKTSGATGMHIYVPLHAAYDYDVAKDFANLIAGLVNEEIPELTSLERKPGKRQKKVYLDFLQNVQGQTLAAPYSVRPRPGAPVAAPLEWSELRPGLDPALFTIRTIFKRIDKKGDLFRGVLGRGINVETCLRRLESK